MSFAYHFSDLILFGGLLLTMIMAISVGVKANRNSANIWLIGFLVASGAVIEVKFLYKTGYILDFPHWFKVHYPIGILRPVFVYLYVFFLLNGSKRFTWIQLLHFVPFVAVTSHLLPFLLMDANYKVGVLKGEITNQLGLIPTGYVYFQLAYSLGYLLAMYVVYKTYRQGHPKPDRSQRQLLMWTKWLLVGGMIYLLTILVVRVLDLNTPYNYFFYEVFSILMAALCIKMLTLPSLVDIDSGVKKYRNSKLMPGEVEMHFNHIKDLMTVQRMYRSEDLKLDDLSRSTGLPNYLISQIINEKYGDSFRNFLNEYRIAEATKMLQTHDRYSIEGIAKDVGFKSRASFYTAFKKQMNLTPSQYLKSVR